MDKNDATVFVVDDDEAVRDSLQMLIESIGHRVRTFPSAIEFLEVYEPEAPGCLVLDVRMPGMSGLDLQENLNEKRCRIPIIFITGHADVPMAVKSIKSGAIDFIQKPFRDQDLLDRIQQALDLDAGTRSERIERDEIAKRVAKLTPREREVMELIVKGDPNKAIAYEFGLSERTIEVHRARVMEKMMAGSLPQLVQMVMKYRL